MHGGAAGRKTEARGALCFGPLTGEGWVEGAAGGCGGSCPHTVLLHSNVQGDSQTGICITIEPGLLLKGDILVRSSPPPAREAGGQWSLCPKGLLAAWRLV